MQSFVLGSGNRVVVDDSGIRVESPAGSQIASFDFSDIRSATKSASGVTVVRSDGQSFEFPTDPASAEGLAAALSTGIQREAPSGGFLNRVTRAAQATASEYRESTARNAAAIETYRIAAQDAGVDFDNASQLQRIQGGLVEGETLYAVYDMKGGGTGFVGITDRRLIIQDEGKIRKRRSLISIPYSRITMLASADQGGLLRASSELTVIAGSQEFELEFRSGSKAERAYNYIIQHLT